MKIIINIPAYDDREKIVMALANSGINVKVERITQESCLDNHITYYVVFDYEEKKE